MTSGTVLAGVGLPLIAGHRCLETNTVVRINSPRVCCFSDFREGLLNKPYNLDKYRRPKLDIRLNVCSALSTLLFCHFESISSPNYGSS